MDSQTSGGNASARIIGLARGGGWVGLSKKETERRGREQSGIYLFLSSPPASFYFHFILHPPARVQSLGLTIDRQP